jgi:hypothetical protein
LHPLAHRLTPPEVLASPPPAFPAVRLADLQCVSAPQAQQLAAGPVASLHDLILAVLVTLIQERAGPVFLLDAIHLTDDDVKRFVPGDAFILTDTAVLRITLAIRVEVNTHHGVANTRW